MDEDREEVKANKKTAAGKKVGAKATAKAGDTEADPEKAESAEVKDTKAKKGGKKAAAKVWCKSARVLLSTHCTILGLE